MYYHGIQYRKYPKIISIQIQSNLFIQNHWIIFLVNNQFVSIKSIFIFSNMEFFIPILSKSFHLILHKLLLFLIILSRPVQSISTNDHRTALTATFSKFDLDIIPNPTVRFQIFNICQKALFDTNPTVPILGKSESRIFRNVHSKSMVEIRKLPKRGAFCSGHYIIYNIYIIYILSISI